MAVKPKRPKDKIFFVAIVARIHQRTKRPTDGPRCEPLRGVFFIWLYSCTRDNRWLVSCHIRRCFLNIYSYVYVLFYERVVFCGSTGETSFAHALGAHISVRLLVFWSVGLFCAKFSNDFNKTNGRTVLSVGGRLKRVKSCHNYRHKAFVFWSVGSRFYLPTVATGMFRVTVERIGARPIGHRYGGMGAWVHE